MSSPATRKVMWDREARVFVNQCLDILYSPEDRSAHKAEIDEIQESLALFFEDVYMMDREDSDE